MVAMGRPRKHASDAERKRAWRDKKRRKANQPQAPPARPSLPESEVLHEPGAPGPKNDGARKLFHDANLAAIKEQAERLTLREREGKLVDAAEVRACIARAFGRTTTSLLALPDRVAPQIRILSEDEAIRVLHREISDVLSELRRNLSAGERA